MNRFRGTPGKVWHASKQQGGGILAGGALFLLAFLVGAHLFFPVTSVRQWLTSAVSARTPISLQVEKLSVFPVFTLIARQSTLTFANQTLPPLLLDDLHVKPLWSSLLSGDPGLSVNATLLQGQIDAAIRRSGNLAVNVHGVQLQAFPLSQETQTLLSGTIVKGDLRGRLPAKQGSDNQFTLEMDNASLSVMGQPVALGKISLQGNGQGNHLRITTLTASGGDVAITGNATVLLGTTAATSRINLDLTMRPLPAVAPLLDLVAQKQPDNSYRLRLSGSLSKPAIAQAAPANQQSDETSDD